MSTPTAFLASLTGQPVLVKLYSGEQYNGTLDSIDGYMNITLEEASEGSKQLGDVFIRGNNVLYISQ